MPGGGCGQVSGSAALELWCRLELAGYPGLSISNMSSDWRSGVAFCGLIHRFRPDLIDMSAVSRAEDTEQWRWNCELAFSIAQEHLGIPALLEPGDVVDFDHPDQLSILTYTSQFYHKFAKVPSQPQQEELSQMFCIFQSGSSARRARSVSRRRGAVHSLMQEEEARRARSVSSLTHRADSPPIEKENPFKKSEGCGGSDSDYQDIIRRPKQFIPRQSRTSRELKVRSLFLEGEEKENLFKIAELETGARPRHVLSYSSYAMPYRSCETLSGALERAMPSKILSSNQNQALDNAKEPPGQHQRKKSSKLLSNLIKNGVEKLQQVRKKKSTDKCFEKKFEDSGKFSELHTIL